MKNKRGDILPKGQGTANALGAAVGIINPAAGLAIKGVYNKIRGKGTAHQDVYNKMPKLFYAYSTGLPGSSNWKIPNHTAGIFNIETGEYYPGQRTPRLVDYYNSKGGRDLEKSARKEGERVTGLIALAVATVDPNDYAGLETIDGIKYDNNFMHGLVSTPAAGNGSSGFNQAVSQSAGTSKIATKNLTQKEKTNPIATIGIIALLGKLLGVF